MDKRIFKLHAEICKTMANPKRIEIINALRDGEKSTGDLVSTLDVSKANVSQHLAVLRQKGIVIDRREGVNVYYRIANPKVIQACDLMREVLLEQLEAGQKLARDITAISK